MLKLLLIILSGLGIWLLRNAWQQKPLHSPYSLVSIFPPASKKLLVCTRLPTYLYWVAVWLFALTLCLMEWQRPVITSSQDKDNQEGQLKTLPRQGLALYFVVDRSGSMAERASLRVEDVVTSKPKIDWMKEIVKDLVIGNQELGLRSREQDLIGLIAFARAANVICPLTFDHQLIIRKLNEIQPVTHERLDGTGIGYAIFKTTQLIQATRYFTQQRATQEGKPSYGITSQVMVVITDGLQSPHPDDKSSDYRFMSLEEAARIAQENKIRVYIISVEPKLAESRFHIGREELKNSAEVTGGRFFQAGETGSITKIYHQIDQLETSQIGYERRAKIDEDQENGQGNILPKQIKSRYILGLALICLFFAVVGETIIWKTYP